MLPARKWQKKKDDIKIGDVCLLLYKGRVKDDYKLCRVLQLHPGQDQLVRTVTVGHRRKNVKDTQKVMEDPSKYRSLPMVEERVHVQRLAVLQHLDPPSELMSKLDVQPSELMSKSDVQPSELMSNELMSKIDVQPSELMSNELMSKIDVQPLQPPSES